MKIAIVRGKYLNQYEMQSFEPLAKKHQLTGFSSLRPFHDKFSFPVVKLLSPMDLPDFPFKMPVLNRLFIDAQLLFGLEEKLRGFDIAHSAETYFGFTQQCLNAKRRGYVKKVVATVWENIPFANEGILGRKNFKKRARQEIDHFICVSKGAKEALIFEGCNESKISVVPPGVDTERFKPLAKPRGRDKIITILFAGRLEEEKGVKELLEAYKQLIIDSELTIKLKIAEKRDYQDMPQAYREADIFVLPSKKTKTWQEQFGMVLVEAMASSLPIVATKSGAIPEVVGEAGILVEEGNAGELYKALKRVSEDKSLRIKLGKIGRERAKKYFDSQKTARAIEKIYGEK